MGTKGKFLSHIKSVSGIAISLINVLIALLALHKSCESNRISREANRISREANRMANRAFEEPIMSIKEFIAYDRERPVDIYWPPGFKEDPNFVRTLDKIIKDSVENLLVILNEGAIAAVPLGDTPSVKIKISSKFPFRIFSIGISGVPERNWKWEVSYDQDNEQVSFINIYENFPPQKAFTITFLYYLRKKLLISDLNQVLVKYFEVSVWSPKSLRSQPCLWVGGEIKRSPKVLER